MTRMKMRGIPIVIMMMTMANINAFILVHQNPKSSLPIQVNTAQLNLKQYHRSSKTSLFPNTKSKKSKTHTTTLSLSLASNNINKSSSLSTPKKSNFFTRMKTQSKTLLRVTLPSLLFGILATLSYPTAVRFLMKKQNLLLSSLSTDFIGHFLSFLGLLYGLLVGQTYGFVYTQQESLYYALFNEVTEAKSLLEQVALVCQGRGSMYPKVLSQIRQYITQDLKQLGGGISPSEVLSARPVDDPLESIMYMTSVGEPGLIYQTIRSLRQARSARLGALQRKVPPVHIALLWILSTLIWLGFPLLGAASLSSTAATGTAAATGAMTIAWKSVESILFGVITFADVLTKRLVGELLQPVGGAYNVDEVLNVMVRGLESELEERMSGTR